MEILKTNYKKILITFVITIITALLLIFTTQNTYAQSSIAQINQSITGDTEILGDPDKTPGRIGIEFDDFRSDGLSFLTLKIGRSFNFNTHLGKSVTFNNLPYTIFTNRFTHQGHNSEIHDVNSITFTVMKDSINVTIGNHLFENIKSIHGSSSLSVMLIEEDVNLVLTYAEDNINNPRTFKFRRNGDALGAPNYTAFNNRAGHRQALYLDFERTQEVGFDYILNGTNEVFEIYHAYEWIESEEVRVQFTHHLGDPLEPIIFSFEDGSSLLGKTFKDIGLVLPTPTRDNHEFLWWEYEYIPTMWIGFNPENVNIVKGHFGQDNVTLELKAEWLEIFDEYDVYIYGNGATDDYWKEYQGFYPLRLKVDRGGLIEKPDEIPYKKNYRFIGWSTGASVFSEYDFNTPVEGTVQLHAFFEYISHANITYETNGGSVANNLSRQAFDSEVKYEIPSKARNGFIGWYLDKELTIKAPTKLFKNNLEHHDFMVYAKWQDNSGTLYFDTNDGSNISPIVLEFGQRVILPDYPPFRHGYIFKGWYQNQQLTILVPEFFEFNETTTIYAGWEVDPDYDEPPTDITPGVQDDSTILYIALGIIGVGLLYVLLTPKKRRY